MRSSRGGTIRRRFPGSGGVHITPSLVGVPDYTALPVASLDTLTLEPDWTTYVTTVRSAAAGTVYTDPSTGVRVVKVTDATTPNVNTSGRTHYSGGGPFTSLPLDAAGTISVSLNGAALFDIAPNGLPVNWRTPSVGTPGELRFAFSRNPVTPWRAYQLVNKTLHRINHVTGASDPGDGFPYDLSALCPTTAPNWMSVANLDAAIGLQSREQLAENVIVVRPSDTSVTSRSQAQLRTATGDATLTINECYISNDGRYLMVAFDQSGRLAVWDTVTGFVSGVSTDAMRGAQFSHPAPVDAAGFIAQNPMGSRLTTALFVCAPVLADGQTPPSVTIVTTPSLTSLGFAHNASQWRGATPAWVVGQNAGFGWNGNDPSNRGAWVLESGQIYRAVVNAGLGYGASERGVTHVVRRAGTSSTDAFAATVRRASSVGDMTEDSWWYDAATRTLYLWQLGGGTPDARYVASLPTGPWNWGIAALRADGSDQRVIAHSYSAQTDYYALAFPHQSQDGRWVLWATDHGVPNGRVDVLMAQLPVTSESYTSLSAVYRTWGTPVDTTARFTVPLPPNNSYTTDDVRLFYNGVEQSVYVEALRGHHNNGSGGDGGVRAFYLACDAAGWMDSTACEVRLGDGVRGTTDLDSVGRGPETVTQSVIINPRVVLVTDPTYLCASRATMLPLVPATEQTAHETAFFDTLHDAAVETWVDVRWGQYNPWSGTVQPQWNLDATAGYQASRGYWAKYCRTGNTDYWWRGTRHLAAFYSGYGNNVIPAEQWSMLYFDFGVGYVMTGFVPYWERTVATTIASAASGAALSSAVEATAKAAHISSAYGNRFNLRQKWSAVAAAAIDATRTSASRQPNFTAEMPWMIDSLAATAFNRSDLTCLAGLIGMNQYATSEDPTGFPIFQLSVTNAWLMDYYFNVQADARIPLMVKANLDVLLGQLNDAGGGTRGADYLWGCPKRTGTGRGLLTMFAAQAAWIAAQFDTGGSTTYADLYEDCTHAANLSVSQDIQYNATKLYGEAWGWTQSAPFFRVHGNPGGPVSIREPELHP